MSQNTLLMGAVAYDPKVVTIWEGFREFFAEKGLDFDFILYSNYERQVEAHFQGHYDVAWNSPLAWIQAERIANACGRKATAIAMRDTDQDLQSVLLVKANSNIKNLENIKGKVVAVGAPDSPQATLIPLGFLAENGLEPGRDFEVQRHDLLVGKHGDHIGGEREAVKSLLEGNADVACVIDANYLNFTKEGTIPSGAARVLAETDAYDHCCFTILEDAPQHLIEPFTKELLAMSYDDPKVRHLLDLEGLKVWKEGRVSGFGPLNRAVDRFEYSKDFMERVSKQSQS